ncbi:N-(5'-phosphoribosyl)anthranilate isomerase [Gammaproteobacteria bacterium]
MPKQILIKLCGIKTKAVALAAAKMGADFIGIVFHPSSKRFVSPPQAKIINAAAERGGAKGVGIFVDHSASAILSMCKLTGIKIVQLHGVIAKQESYKLPQNIKRIYVVNVDSSGMILDACDRKNIECLDPKRDFLLFDGVEAGSGKSFNLNHFKCVHNFSFFLAGGLSVNNVARAIGMVRPNGVDVSSGIEKDFGKKDLKLIKQFIMKTKAGEKND